MDFSSLLKGLGAAASSPLAFVAYLGAITAWAVLRWRVDRHKNLLAALDKVPANDRYKALKNEMGVVRLKEGLTPEQFLSSRIHLYYFLSFVVLCFVMVVLFAISAYKTMGNDSRKQPEVSPEDPGRALQQGVDEIDLGVDRNFIIGKLGQPRHVAKTKVALCMDYQFDFAKILFLFDKHDSLSYMYVAAVRNSYQPRFLNKYTSDPHLQGGCLGCFSFRDADFEPEDDTYPPSVVWFNMPGSGSPVIYVEQYSPIPSWQREVFLVHTSDGFEDDGGEQRDTWIAIADTMMKWSLQPFDSFFKKLSAEEQKHFNSARGKFKPNAYALISNGFQASINDQDFDKGEIGSIYCRP
jgi:low affinity Fe/Cu permease